MTHILQPYPEYRDSGVAWLGKIPSHWGMERAKWLFQRMARPVQVEDQVVTCFRDGTVTLRMNRRTTGFTESLKEIGYQGVRRGDLVIHAMDAFAGAIGVSDSDGKCTPVYAVCKPKLDLNTHYYGNLLREMARSQYISALAKGIRERSTDFRFETLAALSLPQPPQHEQNFIALYVSQQDLLIRRFIRHKQRLIAALNEQKQAIIQQAVTRGLNPNVRLKPSGMEWLGQIPEHYQRTKLRRLCQSIRDGTHNPPPAVPGEHRLLSVRNIINGRFVTRDDDRTMTSVAFAELQRSYTVNEGDVVLALVGATTGKSAVAEQMQNVTVQRSIGILRPNPKLMHSHFLNLVIKSNVVQSQIRSIMDKYAAQRGIYLNEVGELQIIYPVDIDIQHKIVENANEQTRSLDNVINNSNHEIALMRDYRTRLVADVVTGKLDVRAATADLPALDTTEETVEANFNESDAIDDFFDSDGPDEGESDADDTD